MPTYSIKAPDGKTYSIDGPAGATREQVISEIQKRMDAPMFTPTKPEYTPDDPGVIGSMVIGAGRTGDKLVAGVRNLWNQATGDEEDLQQIQQEQAGRDDAYAGLQKQHPVATFAGEALPYVALPLGMGAGAATKGAQVAANVAKGAGARNAAAGLLKAGRAIKGSTLADATVSGAALGGAYYDDESQLTGAATGLLGGAAGTLAGRAASRAIKPVQSKLFGMPERLAEWGKGKGFRMTPGQSTGSATMRKAEAGLESLAPTSGPFTAVREHNQKKVNQIAIDALGEIGDEMDDNLLGKAHDRMSRRFKELTEGATIQAGDLIDRVEKKMAAYDIDSIDGIEGAGKWFDRILEKVHAGDTISGADYQRLQSRLNTAARNLFKSPSGDKELAFALAAMKDALDDAAEASLGKETRKAFQKVRGQWRTKIALESPGVINPGTGDVSAPTLANVLKRMDKPGMLRGKNKSDLYEAARFGQAFKDIVGNSGTAERSYIKDLLGNAAILGGIGAAGGGISDQSSIGEGLATGLLATGALHGGANLLSRGYIKSGGYPFTKGIAPPLTGLLKDGRRITATGGRIGGLLGAQ